VAGNEPLQFPRHRLWPRKIVASFSVNPGSTSPAGRSSVASITVRDGVAAAPAAWARNVDAGARLLVLRDAAARVMRGRTGASGGRPIHPRPLSATSICRRFVPAPCQFVRAGVPIRARRCRFVRAIPDSAFCCVRLLASRGAGSHARDITIGTDSPVIGTAVATSRPEEPAHVESWTRSPHRDERSLSRDRQPDTRDPWAAGKPFSFPAV